jgi:hypothetical protein
MKAELLFDHPKRMLSFGADMRHCKQKPCRLWRLRPDHPSALRRLRLYSKLLRLVEASQKKLHRQIRSQFQGKRHISFVASDHEISHGRSITWTLRAKQAPAHIHEAWSGTSWIVELAHPGTRNGKPFCATHL